ncbi:MAG: MotA/TolQ/ExbB proton channel family protein [Bacteroidales bacterium]|jgi:biopolymer transport protein ExbB/TolQ|nr:MotA/TolQ/ExbB proton channel family protein [Bacteroidales bacterium]
MELITKTMYWISTGLLVPVVVLLIIFFVRALLLIGSFYSTYMVKMKQNRIIQSKFDEINADNIKQKIDEINLEKTSLLKVYLEKLIENSNSATHCDRIINNFETACQKDMSVSQSLSKLGPILGLMGTLIPMGPALTGLATGDIASMANNMQVAFATTVIGLVIGAIGFITLQIKKRWYNNDINNLEFLAELMKGS